MGTGFAKKKKQARMMQDQISQMQSQLETIEATGNAGNGLVTIVLNGDNDIKDLKIKKECVDPEDVEGLQDLIKVAYADAAKQIKDISMQQMGKMKGLSQFGLG